MKRLEDVLQDLYTYKDGQEALQDLTSTSRAAKWRMWLYNVAFNIWTLYKRFELHKQELYTALYELKPGTARWYRNKALAFLYGFDLYEDSDVFNKEGATDEQIENAQIIKYAAVVESEDESLLIVKIATETDGVLSPVPGEVFEAVIAYFEEIRFAGTRMNIINFLPDNLKLSIRIVRDALVLNADGVKIAGENQATKPVEVAIKEFMKELPFNGQLSLQALVDKIQAVDGVLDLSLDHAQSRWINDEGTSYEDWSTIDISRIPVSGYFAVNLDDVNEIETLSTISYG